MPTEALVPLIKEMRKVELQGIWYRRSDLRQLSVPLKLALR
jgi:hypothetical protein